MRSVQAFVVSPSRHGASFSWLRVCFALNCLFFYAHIGTNFLPDASFQSPVAVALAPLRRHKPSGRLLFISFSWLNAALAVVGAATATG